MGAAMALKKNLSGLDVLLGVTGGVAAYKAVDLASKLTQAGAKVNTIMTANACKLVCPKSFEAVTRSAVYTNLWSEAEEYKIGHVNLVEEADLIVIAPATANVIGKMANGICDDLLSTTLCVAWSKPLLIAAAMNTNMWNNPAVARNIKSIKEMGAQVIGPKEGMLACGTEGIGRMSEPIDILEAIEKIASKISKKNK
jgi:phosphopantothenoylcysteine decarboxylase/phosphopantothenate--cysteine ligase